MRTLLWFTGVCVLSAGCGVTPSTTSPTPIAASSKGFTMSGVVVEEGKEDVGVVGATLRIVDGPNAGRSVTTVEGGGYALKDLVESQFIVNVSAPNHVSTNYRPITLRANLRVDFTLPPAR